MGALQQRITDQMKTALLGGDQFRGGVLRNLKAAILNEEVATGRRDSGLDDAAVEKLVAREVKKRLESAQLYRQNDREELARTEEREAVILQEFLPQQLTQEEIQTLVDAVIADLGGLGQVSSQQMGQVIGAVKAKAGTAADGALVARIVKQTLA